jgi:hypothetical protein
MRVTEMAVAVAVELARLRAENARLFRMLELSPRQAEPPSLTQYVGRILRSHEKKITAEVHDYLDERTGVLAAMLAKRAPGTPVWASPTRAGSRSLQAPAQTANQLREPK